ncbi:EscN/YscN/HrcN family type III secretion system ATPase [Chromobacterium amazonense]|uniref:EscN/YscN/HrcN family type III secretion system ATPase n=1 Tax=Chromobacterium amazonense TaxID=1382803 RepID=A0A2S9X208_9NEIS|nr:FliI/YscN family ATPase [Chromobacterium amazonense]PRP69750.1 EscN/YscN/HrcN family type III secretion system ATPase [Chromobacterium amazonense]
MRLPDYFAVLDAIEPPRLDAGKDGRLEGRLSEVGATLLRAHLPGAGLGELCALPDGEPAEVVAVISEEALLSPYREPVGLCSGMLVRPSGRRADIGVGDAMLGRVVDALGRPIDGLPAPPASCRREIDSDPPDPMQRSVIDTALPMGVRAIDAALTVGVGQRLGIFAPAGCGKSTLLGMLAAGSDADVVVLALIGERGREVREFLEHVLSAEARQRSVVVVATSDRPALERLKAAATATAIAEHFRDQGKNVLLLVDSLTRYARAVREIALAAGEPIVAGGYPPSLYARLPRLLERAGPAARGSITAFYTVLMDDKADALAEEVRSLLDGHIVLSRKLAEANHYPAIDLLASVSRVMHQVAAPAHREAAARLRQLLSAWQEIELLVRVGEYRPGQDADADDAMARRPRINQLLRQRVDEQVRLDAMLAELAETVGLPC